MCLTFDRGSNGLLNHGVLSLSQRIASALAYSSVGEPFDWFYRGFFFHLGRWMISFEMHDLMCVAYSKSHLGLESPEAIWVNAPLYLSSRKGAFRVDGKTVSCFNWIWTTHHWFFFQGFIHGGSIELRSWWHLEKILLKSWCLIFSHDMGSCTSRSKQFCRVQ